MAWETGQGTQNGNTTQTWTVSGSALSTRDVVVVRPTAGSSGVRIESLTKLISPTRHVLRIRVDGASAMAFRVRGGTGY
jgi:hypothetical protein